MDPQGRAPKLPFPLTASPVKAHHPHGRVFEGTRCGQFGNPLWAVWESAVGSLGESTFGDPLWAEASRVSVQNVSKMWLPRVPDGFLFFFAPPALYRVPHYIVPGGPLNRRYPPQNVCAKILTNVRFVQSKNFKNKPFKQNKIILINVL